MCKYWRCCEVESMCGRSLREGVLLICKASMGISAVILLISITFLSVMFVSDSQFNTNPSMAVNLIICLVAACFSIYTILISMLLFWKTNQCTKGDIFICSIWYVSHMAMLALYLLLFIAKVAICFVIKHYFSAVFTISMGVLYEVTVLYFTIVVNSYLHSLDQERYL